MDLGNIVRKELRPLLPNLRDAMRLRAPVSENLLDKEAETELWARVMTMERRAERASIFLRNKISEKDIITGIKTHVERLKQFS